MVGSLPTTCSLDTLSSLPLFPCLSTFPEYVRGMRESHHLLHYRNQKYPSTKSDCSPRDTISLSLLSSLSTCTLYPQLLSIRFYLVAFGISPLLQLFGVVIYLLGGSRTTLSDSLHLGWLKQTVLVRKGVFLHTHTETDITNDGKRSERSIWDGVLNCYFLCYFYLASMEREKDIYSSLLHRDDFS